MMSRSTTLALLCVALGLFAFIVFVERDMIGSSEVSERQARLVPRFVRDRVTEVDIVRGDETISLRRDSAPADTDDSETEAPPLGEWSLTSPVKGPADANAVAALLGAVEWAEPAQRLEDVSDADRATFGLDDPALRLRLRVANEELALRVGGQAPTGTGYYASTDEEGVVFVIAPSLYEALSKDLASLRSKVLFGDALPTPKRLSVKTPEGGYSVEAEGPGFVLREPLVFRASRAKVDAAVDALRGLEIARFADDDVDAGLDAPFLRVELTTERSHLLRVGAPCGEFTAERYAQLDDGPIVCIAEAGLGPLLISADSLRDLAAVTTTAFDVRGLRLEAGDAKLEVKRDGDALRYTLRRGQQSSEGRSTDEAFDAYLEALRGAVATEVIPVEQGDLARYGLDRPRATLRVLQRGEGDPEELIHVGDLSLAGLYVRRGDEPFVLRLPASAAPLFEPAAYRLRSLALLDEDASALKRIDIRASGAGVSETLVVADGAWRLEAPVEAPADVARVADLARRLASLEASAFVVDAPAPEHGLAAPRYVVTSRFEAARDEHGHEHVDDHGHDHGEGPSRPAATHVLRVGSATEGGAFAQLDDEPAVFVLPTPVLDLIERPSADRRALSTSAATIEAVRVEAGGHSVAVRRDGARFVSDDGPADAERTRSLIDVLSSIVAEGVAGYGPAAPSMGLASPRARVFIERAEDVTGPSSYELLIGAEHGSGDARSYYVRRSDIDVSYEVSAQLIDALLSFRP